MTQNRIHDLTVTALSAALAIVLGLVGKALPLRLPQGGSITLETVPIFLVACWKGPRVGCTAGLLTGVLQLLLGAYILHPIQVLLDYPIPFTLLGLSGLVSPRLGILLGGTARFFSHFVSGIVFFASYAPEGTPVWIYSALYNLSYTVPETLIALFAVPFLLKRLPQKNRT